MKTNPQELISPLFNANGGSGLRFRSYFASLAMQGILSNSMAMQAISIDDSIFDKDAAVAEQAIKIADALIDALNSKQSEAAS